MTGKQFKEFANQVPDNAVIEMQDKNDYRQEWKPLDPTKIQARLMVRPQVSESEAVEA